MAPSPRHRNFLGIRWKILLLAGLVLCATGSLLIWQQYHVEMRQFEADQVARHLRTEELVHRLFELQSERLQMQAHLFASLPKVRQDMAEHNAAGLTLDIDPLWSELNMGQGLLGISIYDETQNQLITRGEHGTSLQASMARSVTLHETPLSWLVCAQECAYQSAIPVTYQGKTLGAIAVQGSLESIILDLRQLAGAEIAVFTGIPGMANSPLRGMSLLTASGGVAMRELLHMTETAHWQNDRLQMKYGDQTFQLMLLPAPAIDGVRAYLAFSSDITAQVSLIQMMAQRSVLFGALALLLALFLLYSMLRPTMRRIEHVTGLMPLLGEERFGEVKKLYADRPRSRFPDEADELEELAVTLSNRLEGLRNESREHLRDLAAQARLLEQERDLFTSLFNTAPVLILTYGRDGRIRMANETAQNIGDMGEIGLVGQDFATLFLDAWQRQNHALEMATMVSGGIHHGESSLESYDGRKHDIVWFHTRLAHETGGTPAYLSVGMDVTEHRQIKHQLHKLAECDVVTGLLNRRAFKRELDQLLLSSPHGVLLVCDLDQFTVINEAGGHEAGDAMLLALAAHLETLEPAPVLMARLGSDEFALVYPGMTCTEAIELAPRLNHIWLQHGSTLLTPHALSTCVGIVSFPEHGADADTLLGSAQFALLQAQNRGHGSWLLYSSDDPQRDSLGKQAHWKREVERALEENRLVLHYQPIRNITKGTISHYEALIRMVSSDGTLIMPGEFIGAAESTGLIRQLDRWVINTVVAFVTNRPDLKIALNLSGRSFDDDTVFQTIRMALQQHGVEGKSLQLEITETAALSNMGKATRVMEQLRSLGCAFGLDDFGVGYSSFQYLKELPVDFVKIDGSFIRGLTRNADDAAFVRALHNAVKSYGKTTVAEFVEDEETLALLREIGIDCAQGYLIGRPSANLIN